MSKRPTKTVTDTRRSNIVLNKSADVLLHINVGKEKKMVKLSYTRGWFGSSVRKRKQDG